jgi:Flp pilus assembly CpaE family ATPase
MRVIKAGLPVSVLDMPQLLEPHMSPVLQLIDKLVLVITPDIPSVQATVTALQGLVKLGYNNQQILLVLNQITPSNGLPPESIQKTLRRPINAVIPFEAEMLKATNTGKPLLLLSPQSPASKAIAQLADKLFA